jgi:hypothetical protein
MLYHLGKIVQRLNWQTRWFLALAKFWNKNDNKTVRRVHRLAKDLKLTHKIVNYNDEEILQSALHYSILLCTEIYNFALNRRGFNSQHTPDVDIKVNFTSFQVGYCVSIVDGILSTLKKTTLEDPKSMKKLKRKVNIIHKRLPIFDAQMRLNQNVVDELKSATFFTKEKVRPEIQKELLSLFADTIGVINYYISQWD